MQLTCMVARCRTCNPSIEHANAIVRDMNSVVFDVRSCHAFMQYACMTTWAWRFYWVNIHLSTPGLHGQPVVHGILLTFFYFWLLLTDVSSSASKHNFFFFLFFEILDGCCWLELVLICRSHSYFTIYIIYSTYYVIWICFFFFILTGIWICLYSVHIWE